MNSESEMQENMSIALNFSDRFITFSFIGHPDRVRCAVRDLRFGTNILRTGETRGAPLFEYKIDHVSERVKMTGADLSDPNNEQIDVAVSTAHFDKLVLMMQYCKQIGLEVPGFPFNYLEPGIYTFSYQNENGFMVSGLAGKASYLEHAKHAAILQNAPIEIHPYNRPCNHRFWLSAELEADRQERKARRTQTLQNIQLFDHSASSLAGLEARLRFIEEQVEYLCYQHPLNPGHHSMSGSAKGFLRNYAYFKENVPPEQVRTSSESDINHFIRPVDRPKFFLLAEKHVTLTAQYYPLYRAQQAQSNSGCVLS